MNGNLYRETIFSIRAVLIKMLFLFIYIYLKLALSSNAIAPYHQRHKELIYGTITLNPHLEKYALTYYLHIKNKVQLDINQLSSQMY